MKGKSKDLFKKRIARIKGFITSRERCRWARRCYPRLPVISVLILQFAAAKVPSHPEYPKLTQSYVLKHKLHVYEEEAQCTGADARVAGSNTAAPDDARGGKGKLTEFRFKDVRRDYTLWYKWRNKRAARANCRNKKSLAPHWLAFNYNEWRS